MTTMEFQDAVMEHKDRLTRFGFHYIEQLLKMQNRRIEVIHQAENSKEDLWYRILSAL